MEQLFLLSSIPCKTSYLIQHSPKCISIQIGIPSWIPNLGWNSKLNMDSNWSSKLNTLSEKISHPIVYHHLSQLSVDIQLNEPGDFMFTQLDTPESGALRQWTPAMSNWINWNASWFHWPRTSHKCAVQSAACYVYSPMSRLLLRV